MLHAFQNTSCTQWVMTVFQSCIYTARQQAAFFIGLSSIGLWLVAQLPQIVTNVRTQSAEALSAWFIFEWMCGDTLNLLGCLLTGTANATQVVTAIYFLFMDVVILSKSERLKLENPPISPEVQNFTYHLFRVQCFFKPAGQFIYYGAKKERRQREQRRLELEESLLHPPHSPPPGHGHGHGHGHAVHRHSVTGYAPAPAHHPTMNVRTLVAAAAASSVAVVQTAALVTSSGLALASSSGPTASAALEAAHALLGKEIPICGEIARPQWTWYVGILLGYCSSFCYLMSRVSQITKNIQRQSVEGLSLVMFLIMVLANLTYGLSVLLPMSSRADLRAQAPWVLGSLGCVSMDMFIFSQGIYYGRKKARDLEAAAGEDAEEESRALLGAGPSGSGSGSGSGPHTHEHTHTARHAHRHGHGHGHGHAYRGACAPGTGSDSSRPRSGPGDPDESASRALQQPLLPSPP